MCKCIMPVCSVKQCGARKSKNQPNLTIHRFPANKVLRGKWLDAIGSGNMNPHHKELYVCSLHFEECHFNRTLDVVRLRDNTVPTLFNTPSTSRMEPVLEVYEAGNAPEKFVSVMSQTKEVLAPPYERQSVSKHGAFEYGVNDVQEDLIPVPVLDKPKKLVTSTHILTSKDMPVSCKTIIYIKEHADRVMNFPNDDAAPAREAVNSDFNKVQKLQKLCKEQRKKIKRLNEKIRRQGKKIRTLEELLSELEILKIKNYH